MEEMQQPVPEETPKRKPWLKIVLWAIVIIALLSVLVQYFSAAKYDALVQVINEDRIGVNPTAAKLDFGDLPKNKDAVRTVTLSSTGNTGSWVFVWKRGDIAELMKSNKDSFILAPHTTEKIDFTVHVPNSANYKYYRGKIVIFKIPKLW